MAIQNKILTRKITDPNVTAKDSSGNTLTLSGNVGTLALGKPGDIITRAYGPVAHSAIITGQANGVEFGAFVSDKGILVNSDDSVGIGTKLETVTKLFNGQAGTFLMSGACVVKKSQLTAITGGMHTQSIDARDDEFDADQWKEVTAYSETATYSKGDYVSNSSSYYKAKKDLAAGVTPSAGDNWEVLSGTPAAFSTIAYYVADSLVTYNSKTYANPVAIDNVVIVEVNGLKTDLT